MVAATGSVSAAEDFVERFRGKKGHRISAEGAEI